MQLCASCLSAARLTGCCTLLAAGSGRLHPSQLLRPQPHPLQRQQPSLPQHRSLSLRLPLHPSSSRSHSRHCQASHRVLVAFQCHPPSAGPVPGAPSADALHTLPLQTLTLGVRRFWTNKALTSRVKGFMACTFDVIYATQLMFDVACLAVRCACTCMLCTTCMLCYLSDGLWDGGTAVLRYTRCGVDSIHVSDASPSLWHQLQGLSVVRALTCDYFECTVDGVTIICQPSSMRRCI